MFTRFCRYFFPSVFSFSKVAVDTQQSTCTYICIHGSSLFYGFIFHLSLTLPHRFFFLTESVHMDLLFSLCHFLHFTQFSDVCLLRIFYSSFSWFQSISNVLMSVCVDFLSLLFTFSFACDLSVCRFLSMFFNFSIHLLHISSHYVVGSVFVGVLVYICYIWGCEYVCYFYCGLFSVTTLANWLINFYVSELCINISLCLNGQIEKREKRKRKRTKNERTNEWIEGKLCLKTIVKRKKSVHSWVLGSHCQEN